MPATSSEVKDLVMEAHRDGVNAIEIGQKYNIKPATVYKIIKRYNLPYGLQPKRPLKLKQEMLDTVKEWLEQDCSITLEEMVAKIADQYSVSLHRDTIKRNIFGFYYSFKRDSVVTRHSLEDIETRLEYAKMFQAMDQYADKIIFIDETYVQLHTRIHRVKPLRSGGSRRCKHYSIYAAMSHKSLIFYKSKEINHSNFNVIQHSKRLLEYLATKSIKNAWILMGKAGLEQMETVTNMFADTGHELLFLPPCAPFLNPVENFFRELKKYLKKLEPTEDAEDVFNSVERIPEVVGENDCQKYYQTMKIYIQKCLRKEIIIDPDSIFK